MVSDVFGVLMMRWLGWIRFFDFIIVYIFGSKNFVVDVLLRKLFGFFDLREKELELDIDDEVDVRIWKNDI